jgi:hypothetical protein
MDAEVTGRRCVHAEVLGGNPIAELVKSALEKMPELLGGGGDESESDSAGEDAMPEPGTVVLESNFELGHTSGFYSTPRSQAFTPAPISTDSDSLPSPASEKGLEKADMNLRENYLGALESF